MRISGVGRSPLGADGNRRATVTRTRALGQPVAAQQHRAAIRHVDQITRRALGPVLDVAVKHLGAVCARLHVMALPRGKETGAFHA
jgi:hypothetical protein